MMPASMSRYQWLLVALLSANFGVVFFDRNVLMRRKHGVR